MKKYEPQKIEKKWQEIWQKTKLYQTDENSKKPKFYALDMFPYPSGEGLHVGHPKGYIATDVFSRMKILKGFSVLHPMGWDAFGLPAENYAIKNKIHPKKAVEKNIKRFKEQLSMLGFCYDWEREINTTDPDYYKWTQWIFLKLYEKGLAYESEEPINWCPSCKTGLANEDLENGKCERCDSEIERKPMRQWVLKMTKYADRLLDDLDKENLNWEEQIKEQQRNWIGRSEGSEIDFKIEDSQEKMTVFTTRVDTIFGCTYAVLAPEHNLIEKLKDKIKNWAEVQKYINKAFKKTDLERTELQKNKTGIELKGIKAVNPFNKEEIPVYVADYIIGGYGTGAIMAVPAHDERDLEFAQRYKLSIKEVIVPYFKYGTKRGKPTEKRNLAMAIIRNPKDNTYLCLDWKKTKWRSFPGGGVGGEDYVSAAKREVLEETGYKNIKLVKEYRNTIIEEFYRPHKDSNVVVRYKYLVFELENEEREKVSEKETSQHESVWVKKDKVTNFINIKHINEFWEDYLANKDETVFTDYGNLVDSGEFSGLTSQEAQKKMTDRLVKNKLGRKKVNYKMRDWVFSRQRYWGEPIPIVHCQKCGVVSVPEKDLPVLLPEVENYEPTGTGESPLAAISEWVNTKCPKCKGSAKRETNTMPQWAGSCWYYLRYIDNKNSKALIDKKKEKKWMPVDLYVGGIEHATRHLLYARFWHKFLYDIGAIITNEPFKRLIHVGLIAGEDGRKMSKRWGNVINPDEVVSEFGADAMRLYEMFMGPFTYEVSWSTNGIKGTKRFLERFWTLASEVIDCKKPENPQEIIYSSKEIEETALERSINRTIKKVSEDIEGFRFNTAVSSMMETLNEFYKIKEKLRVEESSLVWKNVIEKFTVALSPFAPHLAEELWERFGHPESIFTKSWPEVDQKLIQEDIITIAIQVNGKLRDTVDVVSGSSASEVETQAKDKPRIKKYLSVGKVVKTIYVDNKLINFIVK